MMVSTINAEIESTAETLYEQVIPFRRTNQGDNIVGRQSDAAAYSSKIEYRTELSIESDPLERGGGHYGVGQVQHFQGDQSFSKANSTFGEMKDKGWWNPVAHFSTTVDVMFYNEQIKTGLVKRYTFESQNNGVIMQSEESSIYLPRSYNFATKNEKTQFYKILLISGIFILTTYEAVMHIILLWKKTRTFMLHRYNQFNVRDVTLILQQTILFVLLVLGYNLFFDQLVNDETQRHFTLPIRQEKNFQYWIIWSQRFKQFRVLLGISCILQCINFLLMVSSFIPSLGILFETVQRAKRDLMTFTLLILVFLFSSSASYYLLFGSRMDQFRSQGHSLNFIFLMLFGEVPLEEMREVHTLLAPIFFAIFVFAFCYFVLIVYTAIISENFQKLRDQRLLLSNATARIVVSEIWPRFVLWGNLICIRNKRENERNFKVSRKQIIRNNWAALNKQEIVTKEQFIIKLKETSQKIIQEREEEVLQWRNQLLGKNKREVHGQSSGSIMRQNLFFLFFVVIAWVFFRTSSNSYQKQEILQPIMTFIERPKYVEAKWKSGQKKDTQLQDVNIYDDIVSYIGSLTNLANTQRGFGLAKPVGETHSRLTTKFYKQLLNRHINTAAVFPVKLPVARFETNVEYGTYDEILRRIVGMHLEDDSEEQEVKDLEILGQSFIPIEKNDYKQSCLGNGGFVFTFDQEMKEKKLNVSITEVMTELKQFKDSSQLQLLDLELYLYSPAYNLFTYVAIEFQFKQSMELRHRFFAYTDNPNKRLSWQMILIFSIYLLLCLFFLGQILKRISKQWRLMTEEARKDNEPKRTKTGELLLWVGIDTLALRDYNVIQVIFIGIFQVIKHLFWTVKKLIVAIVKSCNKNPFKFLEILVLGLNIQVIVLHFKMVMVTRSQEDSRQLESASELAYYQMDYSYYTGITILMMLVKSLEIFQFSMVSSLTISTITSGIVSIINYIVIVFVLLFGEAIAAYIIYGTDMAGFSSVQDSIFSLFNMLNGVFYYSEMYKVAPGFTVPFVIYVLVVHWLLLLNIFLAIIRGSFQEQQSILEWVVMTSEGAKETWSDGLYTVVWRSLSNDWIMKYKKEQQEHDAKRDLAVKQKDDLILGLMDNEVTLKWGYGWTIPSFIVRILHAWLDPDELRMKKDEQVGIEQQAEEKDLSEDYAESNQDRPIVNKDKTLFKLDRDYKVNQGMNPYLKNFDTLIDNACSQQQTAVKQLQKVAGSSSVIQLQEHWEKNSMISSMASNSNYWLFYLDESLLSQTKRRTSFNDLRCFDSFFSSLIIPKAQKFTKFQEYVESVTIEGGEEYEKLCDKMSAESNKTLIQGFQDRFDKSANQQIARLKVDDKIFEGCMNYKYFAWTAIESVQRQNKVTRLIQKNASTDVLAVLSALESLDEINITGKTKAIQPEKSKNATLNRVETNLLQKVVDVCEHKERSNLTDKVTTELTFEGLCASAWRDQSVNMVSNDLRKIWTQLPLRDKYDLWYNKFNVRQRVRLWNGLVFQISWFQRVVSKSMDRTDKKLGPPRQDLKKLIQKVRDLQSKAGQSKNAKVYAQMKGLNSLSKFQLQQMSYLAYGPKEMEALWGTLFSPLQLEKRRSKKRAKSKQKPDSSRKLLFEGGSSEQDSSTNGNQKVSTGGSVRRVEESQKRVRSVSVHSARSSHAKAIEDTQRFIQVQFFFRNMVTYVKQEFKDLYEANDKPQVRSFEKFRHLTEKLSTKFTDQDADDDMENNQIEEERLQLWVLLTKEEKLDMLFHQVVEHEAQIICLLIEAEHGELGVETSVDKIMASDANMEAALNQQIYRKYLAYTRLQAIRKARTYFQNLDQKSHDEDQNIIRYASFLKDRFNKNEKEIKSLIDKKDEKTNELNEFQRQIKKIAAKSEDDSKCHGKANIKNNAVLFTKLIDMQKI